MYSPLHLGHLLNGGPQIGRVVHSSKGLFGLARPTMAASSLFLLVGSSLASSPSPGVSPSPCWYCSDPALLLRRITVVLFPLSLRGHGKSLQNVNFYISADGKTCSVITITKSINTTDYQPLIRGPLWQRSRPHSWLGWGLYLWGEECKARRHPLPPSLIRRHTSLGPVISALCQTYTAVQQFFT